MPGLPSANSYFPYSKNARATKACPSPRWDEANSFEHAASDESDSDKASLSSAEPKSDEAYGLAISKSCDFKLAALIELEAPAMADWNSPAPSFKASPASVEICPELPINRISIFLCKVCNVAASFLQHSVDHVPVCRPHPLPCVLDPSLKPLFLFAAKILLAASRLSAASMTRAAAVAQIVAEKKVKKAALARKIAIDILDRSSNSPSSTVTCGTVAWKRQQDWLKVQGRRRNEN